MTGQSAPVDDHEAPSAAPSAVGACAHGVAWRAHLDGTDCPACNQETARLRAEHAASVAAGAHYRSGHTPEEWANSTPLLPFDPEGVQWDNGEGADEDEEETLP